MSDQPAPDLGDVMTVVEFATKHCNEHCASDDMRREIQQHVDTLLFGAMVHGYTLCTVGIDAEGRVSLLWQSMPEQLWESLLEKSLRAAALHETLRGLM